MNWLDIVIIVCIAIGIIHGLVTGIIKQVISLVSLIAAVLLSGAVAKGIRTWVELHFPDETHWFSPDVQTILFYVLAFLLIICLFALAAKLVDKVINHTPIGAINKLLGAVFGMLLWTLCLSIALNFLTVFDSQYRIISKPVKENSICYEPVRMIFPTFFPYIQEFLKKQ
jgi:membrane protein required for colicin V production